LPDQCDDQAIEVDQEIELALDGENSADSEVGEIAHDRRADHQRIVQTPRAADHHQDEQRDRDPPPTRIRRSRAETASVAQTGVTRRAP
jgi:hypothetical protein